MLESNDLSPQKILQKISTLLLYQSVFDNEIGRAFIELLQTLSVAEIQQQRNLFFSSFDFDLAYGNWFKIMAKNNISWQDFLITEILQNVRSSPLLLIYFYCIDIDIENFRLCLLY